MVDAFEHRYQTRMARKYGQAALTLASVLDHSGEYSAFWYARTAAQHAFLARPDLREAGLETAVSA